VFRLNRLVFYLWSWLICLPLITWGQQSMRRFLIPTVPQQSVSEQKILIDTGAYHARGKDTLFQILNAKREPIAYYRKIMREACFDGQCRPLNLHLYWNITGRYLGLELPPGEFLSKTEHEPFTKNEYQQLDGLLTDSLSPLANFNYNDLTPAVNREKEKLDGVTAPTAQAVLPYVVKGAVYTTYVLWQLVYGDTQQEVRRITKEVLTPSLALEILESPDLSDRFWMLNNMDSLKNLTPSLGQKLLNMVTDTNYSLGERALYAIPVHSLSSDTLQLKLLNRFQTVGYSLKLLILEKLFHAPTLYPQVVTGFAGQLKELNGAPLAAVFRLFTKFRIRDEQTINKIKALQQSNNSYVFNLATTYLKQFAPSF